MKNEKLYFDLQVNGYAGIDFNNPKLTIDELHQACNKLKQDNVKGILATIITADISVMNTAIKNIVNFRERDPLIKEIIFGIHIEGPFISKESGFRGAHPLQYISSVNISKMDSLLNSGNGLVKIVTLAPEIDKKNTLIKMLQKNNVAISAGHCNPSLTQLNSAIDSGLSMFTHLGNGVPQQLHRHDNIIQKVLSLKDKLWVCFIADGIHIPFYVLKNYIELVGTKKCIIVSDAMAAASAQPGTYKLGNLSLEVGTDGIVKERGKNNFAGSSVTMKKSYENIITSLSLSKTDALHLTNTNAQTFLGL